MTPVTQITQPQVKTPANPVSTSVPPPTEKTAKPEPGPVNLVPIPPADQTVKPAQAPLTNPNPRGPNKSVPVSFTNQFPPSMSVKGSQDRTSANTNWPEKVALREAIDKLNLRTSKSSYPEIAEAIKHLEAGYAELAKVNFDNNPTMKAIY